jgi:hypothetical protein
VATREESASDEWLAIEMDEAKLWRWFERKPDINGCATTIKTRPNEQGKSAWAHVGDNSLVHPHRPLQCALRLSMIVGASAVARGLAWRRIAASRKLQALAKLVIDRRSNRARVSKIFLFSFRRDLVPVDLLVETPASHPVPSFDHTHRELLVADLKKREDVARALLAAKNNAVQRREYTLDELKPLLRALLKAGFVHEDFVNAARDLLGDEL